MANIKLKTRAEEYVFVCSYYFSAYYDEAVPLYTELPNLEQRLVL